MEIPWGIENHGRRCESGLVLVGGGEHEARPFAVFLVFIPSYWACWGACGVWRGKQIFATASVATRDPGQCCRRGGEDGNAAGHTGNDSGSGQERHDAVREGLWRC